jgi:2'-5' RNA ligase
MSIRPPAAAAGLYIVAYPVLSEGDAALLRSLRAQYHPSEAGMIGPHFTLVFARPADSHDLLVSHVEAVANETAPIDLVLRRTVLHVDPGVAYAFLEPQEGRQEMMDLHLALNADILSVDENAALVSTKADAAKPADAPHAAYTPHLTIGRSASAPEMRAVLQGLQRQEIAMKARIETLTLIDVGLGRIRELGEFGLDGKIA